MLKLKLQYFGHLMQRTESLEKTLMLGKTEGRRRRGRQDEMVGWHHRLIGHECDQTLGESEGQGSLVCGSPSGLRVGQNTKKLPTKPVGTIRDSRLPGTLEKPLVLRVMLLLHLAGEDGPFGHIAAGS